MAAEQIRIRLIRSPIGEKSIHRRTLKALGLTRLRQEVVKDASPQVRGMAHSVFHLVEVEEVQS